MNPFLAAPIARLTHWKEFRRGLCDLDTLAQLNAVALYWANAPIGRLAYDPDDARSWSSPWDLIYHNQWCRSSVAIGMEHTLRLAGMQASRLMLQLVTDDLYDTLLLLIIDDQYALNYAWGSVYPLPLLPHEVKRRWRFAERGYFQLAV